VRCCRQVVFLLSGWPCAGSGAARVGNGSRFFGWSAVLLQVLEQRLLEAGMPLEPYSGYLDLRRYGSVPHSGFGLGFERLILFATGLENIRESIPFPRWPGHADF
jgi:aspartyl-tRNA synthetase